MTYHMTEEQVKLITRLLACRDSMMRLYGRKGWAKESAEFRTILTGLMRESNTDNPLTVAIQVAKKMSADGYNPTMLLAVAADMCENLTSVLTSAKSESAENVVPEAGIEPATKGL